MNKVMVCYNENNINEYLGEINSVLKNILCNLNPDFDFESNEYSTSEYILIVKKTLLQKMFMTEEDIRTFYTIEYMENELNRLNSQMSRNRQFVFKTFKTIKPEKAHNSGFNYTALINSERAIRTRNNI